MEKDDSGSQMSDMQARMPLVADPLTAGLLAAKEEMDADDIREVLLLNASSILSLVCNEVCAAIASSSTPMPPNNMINLEHVIPSTQGGKARHMITPGKIENAVLVLGLPEAFARAAGDLIERRFHGCDLNMRQLVTFLRFGRAPSNSMNLPSQARGRAARRSRVALDGNTVALYDQGITVRHEASRRSKPTRLEPLIDVERSMSSQLHMSGETSAEEFPSPPTLNLTTSGYANGSSAIGTSRSTPVLPVLSRKRDGAPTRRTTRPRPPPVLVPATSPPMPKAAPSYSFGKGVRPIAGMQMSRLEGLRAIGPRMLGPKGTVLDDGEDQMRECLRDLLCRQSARVIASLRGDGPDNVVSRQSFCGNIGNMFGLQPKDVGSEASRAMLAALGELYSSWETASLGLTVSELNRILHKGGRLTSFVESRRLRDDAIFQAELSVQSPTAKRAHKDRAAKLSEARQALHGIVIQTRDQQLSKRAERVAPVQLEALLQAMAEDTETLVDLFLKWDTNGDGTVCNEEFTAAILKLGFRFAKEVTDELYAFFDKDGSDEVSFEEIESTLRWGRDRKKFRPLLAGWRQMSQSLDISKPLHEQLVTKLRERGLHPTEMFSDWAEDGGTVNRDELQSLMRVLCGVSLSDRELDKLYNSFNKDSNGSVSFLEIDARLRQEAPMKQLIDALSDPSVSESLFEIFETHWDTNGDGQLDKGEFAAALEQLNIKIPDEKSFDEMFALFDEDGGGTISLKELENALRWIQSCEQCEKFRSEAFAFEGTLSIVTQIRRALAINAVRIMDLFREWDVDGDGLLTAEEFKQAMPLLGIHVAEEETRELFDTMDSDGDGIVTFKEFNRMMRRENELLSGMSKEDIFGLPPSTGWRPPSPTVAVVDVDNLRKHVKTEQRLRGLGTGTFHKTSAGTTVLLPPGPPSPSG
jgi:Ca2+-binding EF-hand superfamily protein